MLVIDDVERSSGMVRLSARVGAASAACARCGVVSGRVHGRYLRRVRDAAVGGAGVTIELTVRRFRCVNTSCGAVTFSEQVAGLTHRYGRYTPLLVGVLTSIGLALAGRAGARMAASLGVTVGRDTLLRLVRAIPESPMGAVRVLGVDDFAFRRGHRYGTVLVDMQAGRPVDLIDGRDGVTLTTWLLEHPGTEVICRDRAGGYADGARQGAPDAVQVADRFHLWQNLGQAVEKDVSTARGGLAAALAAKAGAKPAVHGMPAVVNRSELKVVTRTRRHYTAVHALLGQGRSKAAIARELGLHPATVRKFAQTPQVDSLIAKNQQRSSILDGFHYHLHRRWNDGVRNATDLTREIIALGYTGTEQPVQRYLRRFRTGLGQIPVPPPRPPSVRDITSWIMTDPDNLTPEDTHALRAARKHSRDLNRLTDHVKDFAIMLTQLEGHRLDAWIVTVEKDSLTALASFARNLRRDLDAVRNGLTLPYNSGPVEGHVNRIKMLKRQMYGRAKLDLLRKRVLYTT